MSFQSYSIGPVKTIIPLDPYPASSPLHIILSNPPTSTTSVLVAIPDHTTMNAGEIQFAPLAPGETQEARFPVGNKDYSILLKADTPTTVHVSIQTEGVPERTVVHTTNWLKVGGGLVGIGGVLIGLYYLYKYMQSRPSSTRLNQSILAKLRQMQK